MAITPEDRAWHYKLINASITALSIRSDGIPESAPGYAEVGFARPPVSIEINGIDAGFVGRTTTDNRIVVAFRGTLVAGPDKPSQDRACRDWTQDLDFQQVDWKYSPTALFIYGQVSRGFRKAARDLSAAISQFVFEELFRHGAGDIWVTGHSKGGALALLMATTLHHEHRNSLVSVVAFGSPCLANDEFGRNYGRDGLETRTVHYVNAHDIIPSVPNIEIPAPPAGWPPYMDDCPRVHQPVHTYPPNEDPNNPYYKRWGSAQYIRPVDEHLYDFEEGTDGEAHYTASLHPDDSQGSAVAHAPQGAYLLSLLPFRSP